ncbi:glycoside hydrolase family 5 protein [Rhodocollybia butyracea]|uniref:Glycoside hydrolase family 5 protein n=1 Tax=Rhodocollybia butyracea TaxID=206335 RepID=A0A9P5UH52_9AGAR|nr:glycoside hydrolase family 5 protein [Rhodocollybia butyracea]
MKHPSLNSASYIPGSVNTYGHDWSHNAVGGNLRTFGRHFIDQYGRVCMLRGVNLSGSSKTPSNHKDDVFPFQHETVTFVGRPFSLEEAPQHFARLRRWGLTFIRFLVTWEAVEHAGQGVYDTDYLAYIRNLLALLPQYGMVAFVSIHQDVWSRYSGGSGAPAWTLEAVGFDLHQLDSESVASSTGAAWLKGVKGGGHIEEERGIWPSGYQKLAAATMATCFWAGDTFTPKLLIKNTKGHSVPIQHFLQNAYLDMTAQLVKAVGDLEGVIGFEMMNEPHRGYVEAPSLHYFDYNTDLHLSAVPSAFESFQLGAGHPTEVSVWTKSFPVPTRKTGRVILNVDKRKVWKVDGPTKGQCLWEMHGVWGWDRNKKAAIVLRESYFNKHPMSGKKIDWYTDFYYPFLNKWADRVRSISSPEKIVFTEMIPNEFCPPSFARENQPLNIVYAPHWYDLNALFNKAFGDFTVNVQGLSRGMFPLRAFYWGHKGARTNFALQIRNIVESAYSVLGDKPVVIGECGIPMDMNKKEAFKTDDFRWQTRMMDAMIVGLERAMVGFTLWNYNPYNSDHTGDDWNGENFSWFSQSRALPPFLLYHDQSSPTLDNGGRILDAVVRPYPAKTAGIPLEFEYEVTTGSFMFKWCNPDPKSSQGAPTVDKPPLAHPEINALETEIFLPSMIAHGRNVVVSGLEEGDLYVYDEGRQTLFVVAKNTQPGKVHNIQVKVVSPEGYKSRPPPFQVNDFWGDYGFVVVAVFVLVCALVLGVSGVVEKFV